MPQGTPEPAALYRAEKADRGGSADGVRLHVMSMIQRWGRAWVSALCATTVAGLALIACPDVGRAAYSPLPGDGDVITEDLCLQPFVPVATPLIDGEGLYPNGTNARPPEHAAAGMAAIGQIAPRDASGAPQPDGKIVLLAIGMSNTMIEFRDFERNVAPYQPGVNPAVELISGAVAGQPADQWLDPDAAPWQVVSDRLAHRGVTPEQVQAVWLKHAYVGTRSWQFLQADLETITGNLRDKFPNLRIVYVSSRTRAYTLDAQATSPEPTAFETGYAVKGLVTKYINGQLPARPFVTWGPYLWADGENARSDGLTWLSEDLLGDCVHPSDSGARKAANLLLAFFTTDVTATPWFMAGGGPPPPQHRVWLPSVSLE